MELRIQRGDRVEGTSLGASYQEGRQLNLESYNIGPQGPKEMSSSIGFMLQIRKLKSRVKGLITVAGRLGQRRPELRCLIVRRTGALGRVQVRPSTF